MTVQSPSMMRARSKQRYTFLFQLFGIWPHWFVFHFISIFHDLKLDINSILILIVLLLKFQAKTNQENSHSVTSKIVMPFPTLCEFESCRKLFLFYGLVEIKRTYHRKRNGRRFWDESETDCKLFPNHSFLLLYDLGLCFPCPISL